MSIIDFFKPQWKHSNPAHRAAAIQAIEEDRQDLLLTVALEGLDAGNRAAAARKLRDKDKLVALKDRCRESTVQDIARRRLNALLSDEAKRAVRSPDELGLRLAALGEISDSKTVEEVARQARSLEVRRAAYGRIARHGAFYGLAMQEQDGQLGLLALDKVRQQGQLENLARGARSREVRAAARDRAKALVQEAARLNGAAVNKAKLELALLAVEKAAEQARRAAAFPDAADEIDWEGSGEQVEEARKAVKELQSKGMPPSAEQARRMEAARLAFEEGFIRYKKEKILREERRHRQEENASAKRGICASLEALAEEEEGSGRENRLEELKQQWARLEPASPGEETELQGRYTRSLETLQARARKRAQMDQETRSRRERGERLEALCAKPRELAGAVRDVLEGRREDRRIELSDLLADLKREWHRLDGNAAPEEFRRNFQDAMDELEEIAEEFYRGNLELRETLLPRFEKLVDSPDVLAAEKDFKELNARWKSAGPVADEAAEGLQARHRGAVDRFREAQDWLRWSNLQAKQQVCQELEVLQDEEDKRTMVTRFKELTGRWKSLGPVPWDSSEALWERYHQVCDVIYERCREYFAELDEEREANLQAKEEICARIEALTRPDDWREAMEAVREAQSAWKALGAVPREQAERVRERYRTACKAFYDAREAFYQENLAGKLELCELAESLQDSTEWRPTAARIREAQEQWKSLGPVPRDQAEQLWKRFHGACEKFFQARREHLDRLEAERPLNQARKEELIRKVESVAELESEPERYRRVREAQAAWKETGPAPREVDDELWQRFRKACDVFFEARKARMDEDRRLKEELCAEAEAMSDSTSWRETAERFKALQERWKALGPAPREIDRRLWKRFRAACDTFFGRLKENAQKRNQDREANLRRKEDLCFEVEMLGGRELSEEETRERMEWQLGKLAENFGANRQKGEMDWKEATETVKAAQREWRRIGPVPRDQNEAVWHRFRAACDYFFAERRQALGLREENPADNLEKKLELIAEAEALAGEEDASRAESKLRDLKRRWRRVGPVPRAQSDYVWERFRAACDSAAASAPSSTMGMKDGSQDTA